MESLFDFEEEARKRREMLEGIEVDDRMIENAGLLPVMEPPKHWLEEARERDGSAKFFGKMLLGGMTGMMPFVFPEAIGGNERYKAELEQHQELQERLALREASGPMFDAISDDDPGNNLANVRQLAMLYPEVYGPVLREMEQKRLAPADATYTEGNYQWDPEYTDDDSDTPGRWFLERQGSDGTSKREYRSPNFKPQVAMPGAEYIEKSIDTADQKQFSAQANADEAGAIIGRMDEIGKDNWIAGYAGDANEFLKRAFGREDFITEVRKQYQDIKVRSAVQNLPPGVASDKDIELVLAPWPNDTSNFDLVRKKLEAIQRVEQGRAAYRLFESEWMATNRSRSGLQRAWLETKQAQGVVNANRNSALDKPYKVITE